MARVAADPPTPMSETEGNAPRKECPKFLAVLDREQLPASFYIPAVSAMLAPETAPAIMKSAGRHEIALHGWIHETLPALDDAAHEQRLLTQSIHQLHQGHRQAAGRVPGRRVRTRST